MRVAIIDSSFFDNKVTSPSAAYTGNGGGMSVGRGSYLCPGCIDHLILSGVKFIENQAGDGAGVYFAGVREIYLVGNTQILGNTASNRGGGVYFSAADSSVYIDGCVIAHNSAQRGGGFINAALNPSLPSVGIYFINGDVYDNEATTVSGGGFVLIVSTAGYSEFVMTGGSIRNNRCLPGQGGGLWCVYDVIRIEGGEISDNTAYTGGGIWSGARTSISITCDTQILRNKALSSGGGIYHGQNSTYTVGPLTISDDVEIKDNTNGRRPVSHSKRSSPARHPPVTDSGSRSRTKLRRNAPAVSSAQATWGSSA
jgi:hypothetical protein